MNGAEGFKPLMDEVGAAKILGISVVTLRRAVKARKIGFTVIGRRRRFTEANVEEYIRRNSVPPLPDVERS